MQTLLDALRNALHTIFTLDADVVEYSGRSLLIALVSTLLAALIGIPLGMLLAENDFRGKRAVVTLLNTLLALPTVVVGLLVYTLLSRTGPLGYLRLLFTVFGVMTGVIAAFGRVVSEVGVAMILGGNIDRFTRTMTTAIVLNVDMGNFALALALGMVLLAISLSINILLQYLQGGGQE